MAKSGAGEKVHSLGLHVTQCWTEAVKYGFLIEGICGLVLSDTQIYVSDPEGAGIAMRMPHLYYHSTISNTQVRCDGSHAMGIDYSPTDDHARNHLMVNQCEVFESSTAVHLGPGARRVWITGNHLQSYGDGIRVDEGATEFFVKDNFIRAVTPINDASGDAAQKVIADNLTP